MKQYKIIECRGVKDSDSRILQVNAIGTFPVPLKNVIDVTSLLDVAFTTSGARQYSFFLDGTAGMFKTPVVEAQGVLLKHEATGSLKYRNKYYSIKSFIATLRYLKHASHRP